MSFWDRLKPQERPAAATSVDLTEAGRRLRIAWDDGRTTEVSAQALRQACPCAQCVDEWTHVRTLDPKSVPADLTVKEARPVGNYALGLLFSDGHATGIFNWTLLRQLSTKEA